VLYQPGDTAWDDGVVVARTAAALAFFDTIFGDFSWPQITNVHRIEGGGTEFPMMVMDGSASEGLIVHEVAHNYAHGILANNEWREGWLDEGFASFFGNWYWEEKGQDPGQLWRGSLEGIREMEIAGETEPIGLPSAEFRDFGTYNAMTYTKPSLVLRSLRWLMGEQAFRAGLRDYFEKNELRHVREADFIAAMEAAHGQDLGWFFEQYIHTTGTLDFALGEVTATQRADGRWDTRVEVTRTGEIVMPVDVRVGDVTQRIDGSDARQVVTVTTATKPAEVELDPERMLIELDVSNNRKPLS
jgi:aminopeptidase N